MRVHDALLATTQSISTAGPVARDGSSGRNALATSIASRFSDAKVVTHSTKKLDGPGKLGKSVLVNQVQ
jgi:hypothetical protein